ncbi:MAG: hypothetical protein ACREJN_20050, partial [Nitrospiraceae bacterium]
FMTVRREIVWNTFLVKRISYLACDDKGTLISSRASRFTNYSSFRHRTTNTDQCVCCRTIVETLSRRNRAVAPTPLPPIMIGSAYHVDATLQMTFEILRHHTHTRQVQPW